MATIVASRNPIFWQSIPGGLPAIVDVSKFAGNIFWVDSAASGASDTAGHGLEPDGPFATISYAKSQCTANQGDVILVLPTHVETVIAAAGLNLNVAGITIIFLGRGNGRGYITFTTDVDADMDIGAADITMINPRFVAGIDALTGPIDVNAARFKLIDATWQDGTSINTTDCLVADANADDLLVDGFEFVDGDAGGTQKESFIQIAGATRPTLKRIKATGDFNTGVIENGTAWIDALLEDLILDNAAAGPAVVAILLQATSSGAARNCHLRVSSGTTYVTADNDMQWFECFGTGTDATAGEKIGTILSGDIEGKVDSVGTQAGSVGTQAGSVGTLVGSVGTQAGSVGTQAGSVGTLVGSVGTQAGSVGTQAGSVGTLVTTANTKVDSVGTQAGSVGTQVGSVGTQAGSVGTLVTTANTKVDSVGTQAGSVGTLVGSVGTQAGSVGTLVDSVGTQAGSVGTLVTTANTKVDSVGTQAGSVGTQAGSVGTQVGSVGTLVTTANTKADSVGTQVGSVGTLVSAIGRPVGKASSLADNAIPNNAQAAGGLLATATGGDVYIEEIVLSKDATPLTGPVNVELSTDNVYGPNAPDDPIAANVAGGLGANDTLVASAGGVTAMKPFVLESGKKLYIHGSDAAGTSGGNLRYAIIGRALTAGATLA